MEKIIKNFSFETKEINESNRTVTFYIARKGVSDLHGDIFTPNSIYFDPNNLRHFKNHDGNKLIGKVLSIGEDETGFYAVSKILPTTLGNDTLIEYLEGAINQHSIGGFVMDYEMQGNNRLIKSFELLEVSSLTTWAAQPDTPVISIKAQKEIDFYYNILKHYNEIKSSIYGKS